MNGLYELETTDMQLSTKTARRATSASTFTAATARARPAGTGPSQTTWQGGTAVLPFYGAATMARCGSPSAQAWIFLRSHGAQGSDPTMKTGTRLT